MLELEITIPAAELFDEKTNEFILTKETKLVLKHSLLSISEWEAKWHIPFFDDRKPKTSQQTLDYVRCMTLNKNVNPIVYRLIPESEAKKIRDYIDDSMTATWFTDEKKGRIGREKITSELIYYWMTVANIPFECEKWHINRLITLIRVFAAKNEKPRKMSRREAAANRAALNARRKAALHSRG